jgi:hypothetical protein
MTDAGEGGGGLLLSPPPPLCAKKPPDGWGHKPVLPTELPDQGHPHRGLRGCVTFARSKTLNYIDTYDTRQGWPTSILSRAKTENFQTLRAAHIFMALKVRGNLIYIYTHTHTHRHTHTYIHTHRIIYKHLWDFRFSWRRLWSSESSGIYCRVVKSMSTDVSEVRAASIRAWWWRQHACLKRRSISIWLYGTTFQKTLNFKQTLVTRWYFIIHA